MEAGAVVALAVVLGHELPVGFDVVRARRRRPEARDVEAREVVDEIAQLLLERGSFLGQRDEQEALPLVEPNRPKAEVLDGEVLEVLRVPGPDEPPLEVVDPGVVRALEPNGRPAGLFDHGGAAVLADVVEGADGVIAATNDQEWLTVDVGDEVRAGS